MKLVNEDNFKGEFKGKQTYLYTLKNKNGLVTQITNYGAKIVSLYVPDKRGEFADIVLGFNSIDEYIKGNPYFGAICGRYANRIGKGKFSIAGKEYQLPINNGENHLHGGPEGFNNQVFETTGLKTSNNVQSLEMIYVSENGEMGYPGKLILSVNYTLTNDNELILEYKATTDATTHVNICSHSFFNLAGEGNGDILDHQLTIYANAFTPVSSSLIPTGELRKVVNTPMDFTKPEKIGKHINNKYDQLEFGKGYDHNWVLNKKPLELSLAATCYEPMSGRKMEVFTTQPGMQLYTGNWLDNNDKGKSGKTYGFRSALCLETQNFPDSPNKPEFPSTLLEKGQVYSHKCVHRFSVK